MPYELIVENGGKPDFVNYDKVYEGNATDLNGNLGEKLESLFEKFNIDRPEDFKGHSLSVSDVVVSENKACYVDVIGFRYLEDFIPLEVKQSQFYDDLPKRLSDISEGKVSPLQDNLLKVGNDALKLNVPPYIMRKLFSEVMMSVFRNWLIHTRRCMTVRTPRSITKSPSLQNICHRENQKCNANKT